MPRRREDKVAGLRVRLVDLSGAGQCQCRFGRAKPVPVGLIEQPDMPLGPLAQIACIGIRRGRVERLQGGGMEQDGAESLPFRQGLPREDLVQLDRWSEGAVSEGTAETLCTLLDAFFARDPALFTARPLAAPRRVTQAASKV